MARLQILELPEGSNDDRPPFVLVVDECAPQRVVLGPDSTWQDHWQLLADKIGARGVIVTPDTIDIPGNDPLSNGDGGTTELHLDGHPWAPSVGLRAAVQEEIQYAQGKLTRALRGQERADERTDTARGMDRLANHKAALTDALGMDQLRDWDDIINAAAGLRRDREVKAEAIESVRDLHRPVHHRGQVICWECSAYDFAGQTTDNAPVAHDQCGTLRALDGGQSPASRDITVDNAAEIVASHDPSRHA